MASTTIDEVVHLPAGLRHRGFVQQRAAPPKSIPAQVQQRAAPPKSIPAQPTASVVNENENGEQIASRESSLMNVIESDRIFHQATVLSVLLLSVSLALRPVGMWLLLFASVYAITPPDEWEYLQAVAVYALVVSLFFVLMHPLGLLQTHGTSTSYSSRCCSNKWSGILVVAVAVPCTAIVGAIFCYQKDKIR